MYRNGVKNNQKLLTQQIHTILEKVNKKNTQILRKQIQETQKF